MKLCIRIMFSLCLMTVVSSQAWAASTKAEVQALQEQVEALQQGQADMKKDLADIKRLLEQGARAAPGVAAFLEQDVTIGSSPVMGDEKATVTMIEYSDYQCPFCARHHKEVMPALVSEYIDKGKLKFVMRESPILSIHPKAFDASLAALCAGDQGQYWEMSTVLFDNQNQLDVDNIKQLAAKLPIDAAVFNDCLDKKSHEKQVNDDLASGSKLGVQGTPGFVLGLTDPDNPDIVNATVYIKGAQPLDNFKKAIDDLLNSAD